MGAWVGRQQAFAVIANKCSAAQALSLKQMKETRSHEKLGLSWHDFCQRHAGISRVQPMAPSIVTRNLETPASVCPAWPVSPPIITARSPSGQARAL